MRSWRRLGRAGGWMAAATALAACTLAVPDQSEEAETRSDGLSRNLPSAGPAPVATMEPTVTPEWVGTCSQTHATYVVKSGAKTCSSIATTGGTWLGCNLQSGVTNGFCIYTWSSSSGAPSNAAYLALEAVAERSLRHPRIVADCSSKPATCSAPRPAGILDYQCRDSEECCVMDPRCVWTCPADTTCAPEEKTCKCLQDTQPSCDVCGFIINGKLTAVVNPSWVSTTTNYTVTSGTTSWSVRPATGAQTFTVPLAGASNTTSVIIRPAQ